MEEEQGLPKIAVSFERKVNLGNYESMGASCILSGITADMDRATIQEALDASDVVFAMVRESLNAKLAAAMPEKVGKR